MQTYSSLDQVQFKNTAVAIGIFDGVHRGHQEVLRQARAAADTNAADQAVALTFDRFPAELVAPGHAPKYLSSISQKLDLIANLTGMDATVVVPFTMPFAGLSPHQFVLDVLVRRFQAKQVFVGADFRYGKGRQGSEMDLEVDGGICGFQVTIVHPISDLGERISSTRIRNLVAASDVETASRLLGHPFALRGVVVEGKRLGRTLGFPTANLALEQPNQLLPSNGIYAGLAYLQPGNQIDSRPVRAAVSIGTNPTTDGVNDIRKVEAFLMDGFSYDLYGQKLDLAICHKIRDEIVFDSLDELKSQMHRDVEKIAERLDGSQYSLSALGLVSGRAAD